MLWHFHKRIPFSCWNCEPPISECLTEIFIFCLHLIFNTPPVFAAAIPTPSIVGNSSIRHAIGDQVTMTCIFNGLVRGRVNWTSPVGSIIQDSAIYTTNTMVSNLCNYLKNTLLPIQNTAYWIFVKSCHGEIVKCPTSMCWRMRLYHQL